MKKDSPWILIKIKKLFLIFVPKKLHKNMIAIVDGGATKCDWVLLQENGKEILLKTQTIGLNPNIIAHDKIANEIEKNPDLIKIKNDLKNIYFYGAGCGFDENKEIVKSEIQKVFPNAEISVQEDLTAAAYAAYQGTPAIVCILGTGSNSCLFDGETLHRELPSLGHMLGDEGSGSAIGKAIVRDFFMKKLPKDLADDFEQTYQLSAAQRIQKIYHSPMANSYLASFNKFVAERKNHPYLQNLVFQEMKRFFEYHILPYKNCFSCEINFVGSISYIYQDILKSVASYYRLNIGTIVQKPIENLVKYHQKYILK